MKVDWERIYATRGPYSGHGSRGACATRKIAAITDAIARFRPRSLLDVGCGDLFVVSQVDLAGVDYLGIDNSRVLMDLLPSERRGLSVRNMDMFDLDADASFDMVLCFDVLIHTDSLEEYRAFTRKLRSLARKCLLVSGFEDRSATTEVPGSSVYFHESILDSFCDVPTSVLCKYRETSAVLVDLRNTGQIFTRVLHEEKPIIWTYWENPPESPMRPPYIGLCRETIEKHCSDDFDLKELNEASIHEYLPDLPEKWRGIRCIAHKADFIRAALIHRYGGIWLDSDIIVLRNLRSMWDRLRRSRSDFIGCGRPGRRPSNGIFGGLKGSALLGEYVEQMRQIIDASESLRFAWTELGYQTLWPLTKSYKYVQYEFRVCVPVPPSRFRVFFDKRSIDELQPPDLDLRTDTLSVYLYNAMFPAWFKAMREGEILGSDMLVSQLFRKALGISAPRTVFADLQKVSRRKYIPNVLKNHGINRNICEIGVRAGNHLKSLIERAAPRKAVGIDSWVDDGVLSRNDLGMSQASLDVQFNSVKRECVQYGRQCQIVRNYSFDAVCKFEDGYFDFVYIDADHSYSAVYRDLCDWYDKVRPGGVIAGHDYVVRKTKRVQYGVVDAVNQFVAEKGLKMFCTTSERYASWIIVKELTT